MQALWRNMMRSALTTLGVFIGVAALIAMVAVGQGANEAVRKQIERLGTNLVVVAPGARTMGGMRAGSGSASTLTINDTLAIQRESAAVSEVSYLIRQSGQVEFGNQNWTTQIQGISTNYPPMTNWRIVSGRETPLDCDRVDDVTIPVVVTLTRTTTTITATVKPTDAPLPEREVCGENLDAVGNLTLPATHEISMESPPLTVDNRTTAIADTVVTLDGNSYPFGDYVPLSFSGTETGRWRVTVQHV
jgi:hypothetical protein